MRLACNTATSLVLTTCIGLGAPAIAAPNGDSLSDDRIEIAIEDEMVQARRVSADGIDISATNGVVTLTGTVPAILERDRAVRIARMVKGVRSVIDRIEVADSDRESSEIRSDVLSALAADPATDSWELKATVTDDVVTLSGTVDSYAERELAATIAKGVKGVRDLVNAVTVDYDPNRTDYDVKQDIVQRMKWDARLDGDDVKVEVKGGDVTLTGTVGSAHERSLAIGNAWVAGVQSVKADGLKVEWWEKASMLRTAPATPGDDAIAEAVEDAFLYDPRVNSFNPTIIVADGVVTLTGTVHDLKAKRAAAQVASDTVGVRRVRNYLKVRPAGDPVDETIERSVAAAFLRDAVVERHEITIDVIDGTAYLYGDVDSYYERARAEDLAARTLGVIEVENKLDVGYPLYSYHWYYDWDPILYDYDFDYGTIITLSDSEIAEDIRSELFWSPFVDQDEVTVKVVAGVATLTGTVDSWSEYHAATENAIEGGATRIVNNLKVNSG